MSVTKAVKKAAPKATEPDKPKETREAKLARLSAHRVNAALKRINMVGRLTAYRPTQEQTDKIMAALGDMCSRVEMRLRAAKQEVDTFSL